MIDRKEIGNYEVILKQTSWNDYWIVEVYDKNKVYSIEDRNFAKDEAKAREFFENKITELTKLVSAQNPGATEK